jgi:hypothetical protein
MIVDLIIITLFCLALLSNKQQVAISMSAYCMTVIYACAFLGDSAPYDDHIAYAALCVPFILISNKLGAYGLAVYSAFNLFVAFDYLIYPNIDTILSSNFTLIQMVLAFCLILTSLTGRHNGDRLHTTTIENCINRLGGLWCSSTCTQKMERKR